MPSPSPTAARLCELCKQTLWDKYQKLAVNHARTHFNLEKARGEGEPILSALFPAALLSS